MYFLAMNTSTQQHTIIVTTHRLTAEPRKKKFRPAYRHCQESNLGYENIRQNLK